MEKIWKFLREPINLALITAIAGGLGWAWHEFHPKPVEPKAVAVPAPPDVTATNSTVVMGNVNQNATSKGDNSPATNVAPGGTVNNFGSGPPK